MAPITVRPDSPPLRASTSARAWAISANASLARRASFSASRVGTIPKLVFSNRRHAEQALEIARGAVNAGLRHVLRARGQGEVAVLDDGDEREQVHGAHER